MLSEFGEDKLNPERALEAIKQATSIDGMLFFVRHHLMPHFLQAIRKAEDDDVAKTMVAFYLGEIEEALSALGEAFSTATALRLNDITEEQLLNFMKEHIMVIIHKYADIKNGMSLWHVISGLESEAYYLHEVIRNYNKIVGSEIRNLREGLRKITANV
jgi:hypothetical protein